MSEREQLVKRAKALLEVTWVEPSQPFANALEVINGLLSLLPKEGVNVPIVRKLPSVHKDARNDYCPITETHQHVVENLYLNSPVDSLSGPFIGCTKCGFPVA